jgi:hypothetical protein
MKREPVSKRTRTEFREFLVGWTLHEIEIEFDSVGIACNREYDPKLSGERRSFVEQFYHTLDFADPGDTKKLLQAYENILNKARQKAEAMATGLYGPPCGDDGRRLDELIEWLKRDELTYRNGRIVPCGNAGDPGTNTITEVTRRNIEDYVTVADLAWWGRLSPTSFLTRLYDLHSMPSDDPRFKSAFDDIQKHTECNDDWAIAWVFGDARFDLRHCGDEEFVRFLAEVLHPVVQPDLAEVNRLVTEFNSRLEPDGWRLEQSGELSGCPLFTGERIGTSAPPTLAHAKTLAESLDANYLGRQIKRMEDGLRFDVELAIGTAKEFVETICHTILEKSGLHATRKDDLPKLVKQTMKQLKLTPDEIPNTAKGANTIRVLLSNLSTVVKGLAELRNLYGSGHGKHAKSGGLGLRHAKLAVGAATTLGVFLFETFEERQAAKSPGPDEEVA